ncbi:hypothetical protein [Paraburkholderia hayleyella]|uniref:hypothetical protein n=1 Tax=Paraburkholderia hayleyella TaxID=2152889 RepID=UPI0012916E9A|nr:hypothetical protein [Paraburkholderia hayleyella]
MRSTRSPAVRALRHHVARTHALAAQRRDVHGKEGGVHAWFRRFFSLLRLPGGSRRFSLRTLLRRPLPLVSTGLAMAPFSALVVQPVHPPLTGRRPRRMTRASADADWFVFSGR